LKKWQLCVGIQVIFVDNLYVLRGKNRVSFPSKQCTVLFAAPLCLCRPGCRPTFPL